MKVLFVTKGEPDYQNDCVLHGLYSLLGKDLTHTSDYDLMYKQKTTPETLLNTYGRGFTIWGNLPEYLNDNTDIPAKIKKRYFDLIIYGSVRRCVDYYDIAKDHYKKNEIILIDGEDDTYVIDSLGHPLFKRELVNNYENAFPISFAIPEEKIVKSSVEKKKKIADYTPKVSGSGYMYTSEAEYYKNYQEALYGLTHKKSGWDCMRHYEILGNCCIPYFPDIAGCPELTMKNFPKDLVKRGNELFETESDEQQEILQSLFEYTKNNLTTLHLAKYIINKIWK